MQKLLSLKIILKKLETFDLSYFRGKNYFVEDGTKNYLVFPPIFRYFKTNLISSVTNYVLSWKSKGLSGETIEAPSTSNNSLTPSLVLRKGPTQGLESTLTAKNCILLINSRNFA